MAFRTTYTKNEGRQILQCDSQEYCEILHHVAFKDNPSYKTTIVCIVSINWVICIGVVGNRPLLLSDTSI
jgi:hypothetical protein